MNKNLKNRCMTIQEAIEKANVGGYNGYPKSFCEECGNYESPKGGSIFLDPLFWQALGKAMGWKNETCRGCSMTRDRRPEKMEEFCYCTDPDTSPNKPPEFIPTWLFRWYRFIDHLAEGKDIESFFEQLKLNE